MPLVGHSSVQLTLDLRGKLFEHIAILKLLNERNVAFLAFFQNFLERIQAIDILRAVYEELVEAAQDGAKPLVTLCKGGSIWLGGSGGAIYLSIIV